MKAAFLLSLLSCTVVLANAADQPLKNAEYKFKRMGRMHAYSSKITGFGHAPSDNFPKPAPQALLEDRKMALKFDLKETRPLGDGSDGIVLRLVNGTGSEVVLHASDSRLAIIQEAQDSSGSWKEIEYLPSSWCGNSYHTLSLQPGECWEFVAPRYTGPLKTRLRFKMLRGEKAGPLFSAEFEGAIWPEQFTLEELRVSAGLMDPYARTPEAKEKGAAEPVRNSGPPPVPSNLR